MSRSSLGRHPDMLLLSDWAQFQQERELAMGMRGLRVDEGLIMKRSSVLCSAAFTRSVLGLESKIGRNPCLVVLRLVTS